MEYVIIGLFVAIVVASLILNKRSKKGIGKNVNHPQSGGRGNKPSKIENK